MNKNKDLFPLSEAQCQEMEKLPLALVKQISNTKVALSTSVAMSGGTHESIASQMCKPRETLTRFLNCNGGLNINEIRSLINATGNLVILQHLAYSFGQELTPLDGKAKRISDLQEELKRLSA